MKNLTLSIAWLCWLWLAAACTNPQPPQSSPVPEPSEPLCHQSYLVYKETADIWQNSWHYINAQAGLSEEAYVSARVLKKERLHEALEKCPDCSGVRVYYALSEATEVFPTAPELILINTHNCNDVLSGDSLALSSLNDGTFLDLETARSYICNWQELMQNQAPVFMRTWGVTYNKERFWGELDGQEYAKFSYAIHAVDPALDSLFGKQGDGDVRGNLALNMLLGTEPALEHRDQLDFSLPCPRFCGGNQALNCADAS